MSTVMQVAHEEADKLLQHADKDKVNILRCHVHRERDAVEISTCCLVLPQILISMIQCISIALSLSLLHRMGR